MNGDEKTLPEFKERDASSAVSAGNVSEGMSQEGVVGGLRDSCAIAGSSFIQNHVDTVYIIL
jgi:hypothetical protein